MLERTLLGQISAAGNQPWPEGYGNAPHPGQPSWPSGYGAAPRWATQLIGNGLLCWRRVQPSPWPEGYGHT